MPPDESEEDTAMQRGQRRSPQPSRPGQPQRTPQRRPATYRRRRRRSKRPIVFAAIAVIVVVLIVMISVSVHDAREDARLTAKIKANADAVTPFSDQVETAEVDSLIVFNEGGVKITLTGYKSNGVIGDEINYVLENSSSVPVMFGVGDAYVDGWKITTLGGNTLPSGTKTNGTIYLSREDLKQSGITTITSVTLKDCNIWNDESSEIMATFDIVVNVG